MDEDDWFFKAVEYAYANKLFSGTSAKTFSPEVAMTRAMLVTVLYSLEGDPAVSGSSSFSDVDADDWYHDAVLWAAKNGVVAGYDDGSFGSTDIVTREQMAVILHKYAQYKDMDVSVGENTNILSYTDVDELSEWAIAAMQWACGEGLISGKGNGILDPVGGATRAEVAQILMVFCEKLVK